VEYKIEAEFSKDSHRLAIGLWKPSDQEDSFDIFFRGCRDFESKSIAEFTQALRSARRLNKTGPINPDD
jgi:hypothetical protein